MIELIVVIILVGILAVVAMPRLTMLTGFKDVAYRDQIKSTIEYARKAAIWQRRFTCVVIAGSTVTLTAELVIPDAHAGACPPVASLTYPALNLPSGKNTISAPSNVTITSPAVPLTIQFNAQGTPTVGGGTVVTITDSSSASSSTLTIEADSGYVH